MNKKDKQAIDWFDMNDKYRAELSSLSPDKFKELYQCEPMPHDDQACLALLEYEDICYAYEGDDPRIVIPNSYGIMKRMAEKYGVTIERMKEHWRCVEYLNKDRKTNQNGK